MIFIGRSSGVWINQDNEQLLLSGIIHSLRDSGAILWRFVVYGQQTVGAVYHILIPPLEVDGWGLTFRSGDDCLCAILPQDG